MGLAAMNKRPVNKQNTIGHHALFLIAAASLALSGCKHIRSATLVSVPDVGETITTKYKYCCIGTSAAALDIWRTGSDYNTGMQYFLKTRMPRVFSDDGIPFYIVERNSRQEYRGMRRNYGSRNWGKWGWFSLHFFSLGIAPLCFGQTDWRRFSVVPIGEGIEPGSVECCTKYDEAMTVFSPFSILCFNASPEFSDMPQGKIFQKTIYGVVSDNEYSDLTKSSAMAYGIATRLKEMEDCGSITASMAKDALVMHAARHEATEIIRIRNMGLVQPPQKVLHKPLLQVVQQAPQKPKFAITSFKPVDADNDFSYSFEVTLNGDVSPDEFLGEYESFLNNLKKIYKSQYPAVDMNSLVVDAKPSLLEGKFVGIARMLTIHIEAMAYDSKTRRGKISARFGHGQERFARNWIKRNIMEPLVKDKNILLETGTLPPPGRYYSLDESVKDGNILEIEFKTE